MYVCMYVCMCLCVCMCACICTHTHTHTHRDDAIDLSGAQKRGQCEFLRTHFLGTDRDVFERSGTDLQHRAFPNLREPMLTHGGLRVESCGLRVEGSALGFRV